MNPHPTVSISVLFLVFLRLISASQAAADDVMPVQTLADPVRHLIDDVPLVNRDSINAVIEISAGSLEKWEVDSQDGYIRQDLEDSSPRVINFLPYPANYGFIPQTIQDPSTNGDGDPVDVIVLSSSMPRGSIVSVEIIGSIQMLDLGEVDDKYVAVMVDSGPFSTIKDLSELALSYPGSVEILRMWFENYKVGAMSFEGYVDSEQAMSRVLEAHEAWSARVKKLGSYLN